MISANADKLEWDTDPRTVQLYDLDEKTGLETFVYTNRTLFRGVSSSGLSYMCQGLAPENIKSIRMVNFGRVVVKDIPPILYRMVADKATEYFPYAHWALELWNSDGLLCTYEKNNRISNADIKLAQSAAPFPWNTWDDTEDDVANSVQGSWPDDLIMRPQSVKSETLCSNSTDGKEVKKHNSSPGYWAKSPGYNQREDTPHLEHVIKPEKHEPGENQSRAPKSPLKRRLMSTEANEQGRGKKLKVHDV